MKCSVLVSFLCLYQHSSESAAIKKPDQFLARSGSRITYQSCCPSQSRKTRADHKSLKASKSCMSERDCCQLGIMVASLILTCRRISSLRKSLCRRYRRSLIIVFRLQDYATDHNSPYLPFPRQFIFG